MDTDPTEDENGAGVPASALDSDSDSSSPETASLPIDFCGDAPQEGDIIRVKVVSVDADNGSFDVVCAPSAKPISGINKAAQSFDEGV